MSVRLVVILAAILAGAGCTAKRQPAGTAVVPVPPFTITFWCGPPLDEFTDARAAEIAAANFTTVGPPCEGGFDADANRRALEIAARHGLRLWIKDTRFGTYAPLSPGWETDLDAAVSEYGRYPALDSYFIMDEPNRSQIDAIAPIVRRLQAADPLRIAYVNLLPDYVSSELLGTENYEEYVESFIGSTQPRLLSYDYYPFGKKNKNRSGFFRNLTTMRTLSLRHGVPFMLIVQAMPHGSYRDPTEGELAWQIFHALAYGARGISYFAYWTPKEVEGADKLKFRYGLIEDGKPTRHYFEAMRLNRKAAALGRELAGAESVAVADSAGVIGPAFPIGPIDAIDGGEITAGLFVDPRGRFHALLVNRDYRYGTTARVQLRPHASIPERFDADSEQWTPEPSLAFTLAPGDAQLVRWATRTRS